VLNPFIADESCEVVEVDAVEAPAKLSLEQQRAIVKNDLKERNCELECLVKKLEEKEVSDTFAFLCFV
jgi:hypothetical protein